MNYSLHSYRYAMEILEHPNYQNAFKEITDVIIQCPLFIYPNKSAANSSLDVVQQLMNTLFDRRFAIDFNWLYHPGATRIPNSNLAADFRKTFNGLRIQIEAQFGNMSRWYSDIFKFQTAYSQDLIDLGVSIVPMNAIATRIDSNVTNYERCVRELPSAKLSITLPILIIGVYLDANTQIINTSNPQFQPISSVSRNTNNRYRIVNGILNGIPIEDIDQGSATGPIPRSIIEPDEE